MNPIQKLFVSAHTFVLQASGGKIGGEMGGTPLLLLTTKGSKSGQARTVPVMCFEDGGSPVVIASAGGSQKHPAWFTNLQHDPNVTVQLRGRKFAARAEVATGAERARLWERVVREQPRFAGY